MSCLSVKISRLLPLDFTVERLQGLELNTSLQESRPLDLKIKRREELNFNLSIIDTADITTIRIDGVDMRVLQICSVTNTYYLIVTPTEPQWITDDEVALYDVFSNTDWVVDSFNCSNSIVLTTPINLNGESITIPKDTLIIGSGGYYYNGTIVGQNTIILDNEKPVFDEVTIKGTWNVPYISTSFFKTLDYSNSLVDIFALTSDTVDNEVLIKNGNYTVDCTDNAYPIKIKSNTKITLNGNVYTPANSRITYSPFQIDGKSNIEITGTGTIEDSKDWSKKPSNTSNADGYDGEWGFGIGIWSGTNIKISGITTKNWYGDGIYIGGSSKPSTNVTIDKVTIQGCRRQGISIANANSITIKNSSISGIYGTDPRCCIDIEPNASNTVDKVTITNNTFSSSFGGLLLYGYASNCKIGEVTIKGNTISGITGARELILIKAAQGLVTIDGNHLINTKFIAADSTYGRHGIEIAHSNVLIKNNTIDVINDNPFVVADRYQSRPASQVTIEDNNNIIYNI